jgi:hypothetical protein
MSAKGRPEQPVSSIRRQVESKIYEVLSDQKFMLGFRIFMSGARGQIRIGMTTYE